LWAVMTPSRASRAQPERAIEQQTARAIGFAATRPRRAGCRAARASSRLRAIGLDEQRRPRTEAKVPHRALRLTLTPASSAATMFRHVLPRPSSYDRASTRPSASTAARSDPAPRAPVRKTGATGEIGAGYSGMLAAAST
jgi:hypothetical protein